MEGGRGVRGKGAKEADGRGEVGCVVGEGDGETLGGAASARGA